MLSIFRSWYNNYSTGKESAKAKKFNFDTIPIDDTFNRTINEINKNLIKHEGHLKTPDLMSAETDEGELKDPRIHPQSSCPGCLFKCFKFNNYQMNSTLTAAERETVFQNSLSNIKNTTFNRSIIKEDPLYTRTSRHPTRSLEQNLTGKLKSESQKFQENAQNNFYKDMMELESHICDDFGQFAVEVWNQKLKNLKVFNSKFQVITQLTDSVTLSGSFDFVKIEEKEKRIGELWIKEFSQVSNDVNHKVCGDFKDLLEFKTIQDSRQITYADPVDVGLFLTPNLIYSVLSNEKISFTEFEIKLDENFQKIISFQDVLPPVEMNLEDALKLGIKNSISMELERQNLNRYLERKSERVSLDYEFLEIDKFMSENLKTFLCKKTVEENFKICEIQGKENSQFAVKFQNNFYSKSGNEFRPVFVSVKLEFQTNFGAQEMTKFELLEEFVNCYFNNSLILRYRVDVGSLMVLSLRILEWQEVVDDLESQFNIGVQDLLNHFACFLNCVQRLPIGNYLLNRRTETESEPSKLMIFQEVDSNSENLLDLNEKFKNINCGIDNTLSSIKFIPISKEISPLHLKNKLAPCIFPFRQGKKIMKRKVFRKNKFIK